MNSGGKFSLNRWENQRRLPGHEAGAHCRSTIVTFLMVFLIQNTQNRDAKAVHLKLDEIIRAVQGARNELVDLEELSDEDLKKLEKQFQRIRQKAEHDGNHPRDVASATRVEESE